MEERKKEKKMTSSSGRQLKAMLRKNWLLKIRHPYITLAEVIPIDHLSLCVLANLSTLNLLFHMSFEFLRYLEERLCVGFFQLNICSGIFLIISVFNLHSFGRISFLVFLCA